MLFSSLLPAPSRVDLPGTTKRPRRPLILRRDQRLLLAAADIIEQRGWTRGRFQDQRGRVCLLGALNVASGTGPEFAIMSPRKHQAYSRAIRRLFGEIGLTVSTDTFNRERLWRYNDGRLWATGATKSEVAALLRRAAYR